MAAYTQADLDAVTTAIVTATVEGFASVTIGGQTVQKMPLRDLLEVQKAIRADLAADQDHLGLRFTQLVPPGAG